MGLNQQVVGLQQHMNAQMRAQLNSMYPGKIVQVPQGKPPHIHMAFDPTWKPEDPDYRAAKDLINETISHYNQEDEDADKLD